MSNMSDRNPEELAMSADSQNQLVKYMQTLDRETMIRLSKPTSPEVIDMIKRTVTEVLKNVPFDRDSQLVITERDDLGHILGAAMLDGYFLRNAEQRLELENLSGMIGDEEMSNIINDD